MCLFGTFSVMSFDLLFCFSDLISPGAGRCGAVRVWVTSVRLSPEIRPSAAVSSANLTCEETCEHPVWLQSARVSPAESGGGVKHSGTYNRKHVCAEHFKHMSVWKRDTGSRTLLTLLPWNDLSMKLRPAASCFCSSVFYGSFKNYCSHGNAENNFILNQLIWNIKFLGRKMFFVCWFEAFLVRCSIFSWSGSYGRK